MTFSLENAIIYDEESYPNLWSLSMECLNNDTKAVWEISSYRDDRRQLFEFIEWCRSVQAPMIGFFSLTYDYTLLHWIMQNPSCTAQEIKAKSDAIIKEQNFLAKTIYVDDRIAPQIDLAKINHFDNRAKATGLKALQVNMRSPTVVESPMSFSENVGPNEVAAVIEYNQHDVKETKRFAHICRKALDFRVGLIPQFGIDVLNYNDTKIGSKLLESKLGDDICFDRSSGRKQPRQTPRSRIALAEIIFPYVRFNNPEFARVLAWMKEQVLTPEDLTDDDNSKIKTKGVFTDVVAHVGGIEFGFGTGGIHGSVKNQRFIADDNWLIRDIDVEGFYVAAAIVNKLAPQHLGDAFIVEYAKMTQERKLYKKGTVQNASYKLAGNGVYGNSNNQFSPFYDPKYTMTVTINGQLMLCMLAEWLLTVPTLQIIQINTDGVTYRIHKDYEPQAQAIQQQWEAYTCLKLERVGYSRMWISDVNTYVAETLDGKLKQKGRLWHPTPGEGYAASIAEASPPAWHKDLGALVTIRAAVAAMVDRIDPETFIRCHGDPFDFMCREKCDRSSHFLLGGERVQSTMRYYVAKHGASLVKISPPKGPIGAFKRANKLSDKFFNEVMTSIPPNTWDERIHTKNKSVYETRETTIQRGWKVADCNDARNFDFRNVDYDWYVTEARKLIVA